jgi:hypothetical protein
MFFLFSRTRRGLGETCILARRKRKSKPNRIYTLTPKKVLYIDTEAYFRANDNTITTLFMKIKACALRLT